jgi:hypothetical protein
VVATVLGSIPASSDTAESEGQQMKQRGIKYWKINFSGFDLQEKMDENLISDPDFSSVSQSEYPETLKWIRIRNLIFHILSSCRQA